MLKKKLSLIAFFLSIVALLAAGDWTVLIYMGADNDLAQQALDDIEQMETALQPQDLNLIVQIDLPDIGAKRYRIEHHPQSGIGSTVLKNLGIVDSGEPDTLNDFIRWGFARYPSRYKMLVLWSHGDSWYKQNKYISPDTDTGHDIGIANQELSMALSGTPKLDILLFDACSMQSIEIAYALKDNANYIIGSADLVPTKGFPYPQIITLFNQSPHSIAVQIPDLYTNFYLPGSPNNPSMYYLNTTCSTIDTAYLSSFDNQFQPYLRTLFGYTEQLRAIRQDLHEMNTGYADADLKQLFVHILNNNILPTQTQQLLDHFEQMVPAYSFTSSYGVEDLSSVAIWFPDNRYFFNNTWCHYFRLSFAKIGWLSLVNAVIGNDNEAPDSPQLINHSQRHGKLIVSFTPPTDPDSLYYHVQSDHADFYYETTAYSSTVTITFPINGSGEYNIYAIDRSGNRSVPLNNNYTYKTPIQSIYSRPNPIRSKSLAYLDWYIDDWQEDTLTLSIYSIRGQRVLRHVFANTLKYAGSLVLSDIPGFASLNAGVYIIELKSNGKSMKCKLTIL